jgi:hypothetical protein
VLVVREEEVPATMLLRPALDVLILRLGKVSGDSLSGRRGASTIIPDLACGRRREYGVRCVVEARDLRFGKFYEVVSDWAWRGL